MGQETYISYHPSFIIHSDYHLFHKNIGIYNFNDRVHIIKRALNNIKNNPLILLDISDDMIENLTETSLNEWINLYTRDELLPYLIEVDKELLKELSLLIEKDCKERKITDYYNMGDLLFNIEKRKLKAYTDFGMVRLLEDFFKNIKNKGIKLHFIYGNHDKKKEKYFNFYSSFFDEIKNNEIIENKDKKVLTVLTHYPLYYSDYTEENFNSFKQNDLELIKEIQPFQTLGYKIVNIHGHTHDKQANESLLHPEIIYINQSIDNNLIKKGQNNI